MAYQGLETYLTDHHAGATAGLNLVRLAAEEHQHDDHGAFFGELAVEIREDYDTLDRLITDMGAKASATKSALAEVGTKVMSPKFTGDDDALNAFVTLETLSIGVEGKRCMWTALKRVQDAYPTLAGLDLDDLAERARSQRERIESKRLELATQALAHTVSA